MSDNIDFARNKGLIVVLARALEASGAADVSEFIAYLEGAASGFGDAAGYDVGILEGQLAALGVGGKFDASLLPDSAGAVWGAITGSIANQTDLIGGSGKLLTSLIPDEVLSAMRYRGTWNATTNVRSVEGTAMPAANGANKGHYYKVSVAGSTNLDGITDWKVGDWVISNGSTYDKIDNTDAVVSVAGLEGAVSATNLTAALNAFTSSLKGLVPASGGGTSNFLRADGTWAAPSAGGGLPSPEAFMLAFVNPSISGSSYAFVWTNYTAAERTITFSAKQLTASTLLIEKGASALSLGSAAPSLTADGTRTGITVPPGHVLVLRSANTWYGTLTCTA